MTARPTVRAFLDGACGVDSPAPDFAATAQAFGICARRAESLAAVRTEVERALAEHLSEVLDVPIGRWWLQLALASRGRKLYTAQGGSNGILA